MKYIFKLSLNKVLKTLSFVVFLSIAFGEQRTLAQTINSAELIEKMETKPIGLGTLDYLKFTNGAKSAYKIEISPETDYSFIYKDTNLQGIVEKRYFKIKLEEFGDNSALQWKNVAQSGDKTIEIKLPNNETIYRQYKILDNSALKSGAAEPVDIGTITNDYTSKTSTFGGAINNSADNADISGNFTLNSAKTSGGAIYNKGENLNLTGNFQENKAKYGGAVYNSSNNSISNLKGKFTSNTSESGGGALYNNGDIVNLTGDFTSNTVDDANGGAINNSSKGTVRKLEGNFNSNSSNNGGAINNVGEIVQIIADFNENIAVDDGGAIHNEGSIEKITGNFTKNQAEFGGAIHNEYDITNINGYFDSNSAKHGGAIRNNDTIDEINGVFVSNSATNCGGVIDNNGGYIESISGDFTSNSAKYGGVIHADGDISNISGNFVQNSASELGGVIYNYVPIENVSGKFISNSAQFGGVIYNYNDSSVKNFSGDFISNSATFYAGAIENFGLIENLTGDFISNSAGEFGGAIRNVVDITNLNSDFISNHAGVSGGAIRNTGDITSLIGDFISNSSGTNGGALYNGGNIKDLAGDFISNSSGTHGGAIYNYLGSITNLSGNFISNKINSYGGAILNGGDVENLKADFNSNTSGISGGAIYNGQNIVNLDSNFESNSAQYGGAIYNDSNGTIKNLHGNFSSNSATDSGGAINNNKIIEKLDANFTSNSAKSGGGINNKGTINSLKGTFASNSADYGGAIYNTGTIDKVADKKFTLNSATTSGGAIYNDGTINSITDGFSSNLAKYGGGIYNLKTIKSITGEDFTSNIATESGGAIRNNGTIESITDVNFASNSAKFGGAIRNVGTINSIIDGNFSSNSATTSGGAIYSDGTIETITNDFSLNSAKFGGAIYNAGAITSITGENFTSNSATEYGGAIYNDNGGMMKSITGGNFTSNSTVNSGGAIYNDGTIETITNGFSLNSAKWGGAIYNASGSKIDSITNNFISNSATTSGGAIHNNGAIDSLASSFVNNSVIAVSETTTPQGGAIYSKTDLNFNIDNKDITFKDNYTQTFDGIKDDNAIYMANKDTSLNFNLKNNSKLNLYDNIRGNDENYNVNISGDPISTFNLYNTLYNAKLNLGSINLNTINNKIYNNPQNPQGLHDSYHFKNITLTNNTNFLADVDLANKQMDRLTSESYGNHKDNQLNIKGLNLISDAKENKTAIYFAQPGLKNNVTLDSSNQKLPNKQHQTTLYTPIYAYDVTYDNQNEYDNKGDGGYLLFKRPGGETPSSNNPNQFNPAILSSPVSNAASQTTLNETFKYAFEHVDSFSQLPLQQRLSQINKNRPKIALTEPNNTQNNYENYNNYQSYSTDYNQNLSSLHPQHNKAGWMRPYTIFETIPLKHGPKIDSINYGSLIGYDGEFKHYENGWDSILTTYLGYNGASIKYKNTDSILNGGIIGLTQTLYKKNFWSATTLTAGANTTRNQTIYGTDDFTSLLAGIATKTGYNFEFKQGKYIIQPMLHANYTFINSQDYTNAANIKIKSNPYHNLQINPNIRFIANLKNGFQPYLGVGMVFNTFHKSKTTANNILLPEMYVKPYVEYNIGLQKNWQDKFSAFFQAMLRNGGRSGIALTAGFRWSVGKDASVKKESKDEMKMEGL